MKEQIRKKLIDRLSETQEYISGKDLAFSLDVSEKTVFKYLNELKEDLKDHGAVLETKQGTGSRMIITDVSLFSQYMDERKREEELNDPETRKNYLLVKLLTAKDYLDVYELADELYVSPTLLRSLLKECEKALRKYDLSLERSHHKGYRVKGSEKNIRRCLSRECRNSNELDQILQKNNPDGKTQKLKQLLADTLEHFHMILPDEGVNSLTLHILIALNRMETGNPIRLDDMHVLNQIKDSPEYYVASYLNKGIQEIMGTSLPEEELAYLTMHISGKQRFLGHEQLQVQVSEEAEIFYNRFLRSIYKMTDVDFFEDDELRVSLFNHIVPFLNRVKDDLQITRTDLNGIKDEFPYAWELAMYGLSVLINEGVPVEPAEISYFALHLALSLEKKKISSIRYNVIILCDETESLYKMLSYRLQKQFHEQINTILLVKASKVKDIPYDDPIGLLVLNTTNHEFNLPVTTVHISSFFTKEDEQKIQEAFNHLAKHSHLSSIADKDLWLRINALGTKEDVIWKMIEAVAKKYVLPEDYYDLVMAREAIESTEYSGRVAIPHALKSVDGCNFVACAVLEQPIVWKEKNVQLVFLINLHDHAAVSGLMDQISTVINDDEAARKLINAKDYDQFLTIFENL